MRFEQNMRSQRRGDFENFSRLVNQRENDSWEAQKISSQQNCKFSNRQRPIGMVYSEKQEWKNVYDSEVGFYNGTIFCELNLPYTRARCSRNGGCSR